MTKLTTLGKRISGAANFKMYVRAGSHACNADLGDNLTLGNLLADGDKDRFSVSVERLGTVRMGYDDVISISAVPTAIFGDNDRAVSRRINRAADTDTEIDRVMSMQPLGQMRPANGTGEISGNGRAAAAKIRLIYDSSGDTDRHIAGSADRAGVGAWYENSVSYSQSRRRRYAVIVEDIGKIGFIFRDDRAYRVAFFDRIGQA